MKVEELVGRRWLVRLQKVSVQVERMRLTQSVGDGEDSEN